MTNEANKDDSMQVEEVTFMTEEDHNMDHSNKGQSNSTTTHVNNVGNNDEPLIFYDWLADSATTSHICNQKKLL